MERTNLLGFCHRFERRRFGSQTRSGKFRYLRHTGNLRQLARHQYMSGMRRPRNAVGLAAPFTRTPRTG